MTSSNNEVYEIKIRREELDSMHTMKVVWASRLSQTVIGTAVVRQSEIEDVYRVENGNLNIPVRSELCDRYNSFKKEQNFS